MTSLNALRYASTVVVLIATLAMPALAGTIRDDVPDANYTALASQNQYAPVGKVLFHNENGSFLASGVLIADDWVLTAGHVVDGTNITATTFTIGGNTYSADLNNIYPYPLFDRNQLLAGYDIGLFKLTSSVPAITPATLYTGGNEVGLTGTSVGYGRTGDGLTGANLPAGTRRAGHNRIDNRGGVIEGLVDFTGVSDRIIFADFDEESNPATNLTGPTNPPIADSLEYLIAAGDSGGGLFVDDPADANATKLVAVHSFGARLQGVGPGGIIVGDQDFFLNSTYGELQGSTRVEPFIPWINNIIPEPASLVVLLIGPAVLTRRRHGS